MEESKQILIAITKLQENVSTMSEQMKELSKIGSSVVEATQSVKSAHNRIDDLKTDFVDKLQAQREDFDGKLAAQKERADKSEESITWLKRAVIGAFIAGGVTFLFGILLFFITRGG